MLQKNIQVTITLSDTKVSQDDMMTPANKRAYKAAMEDLKAGKNVVTIPSTLTTGDDFLSFLQKYDD